MALWQWTCAGVPQAVISVALVNLACDNDDCSDGQAVSASVFTGFESYLYGKPRVLIPLKATKAGPLIGVVEAP
jgi:hypothetical protein